MTDIKRRSTPVQAMIGLAAAALTTGLALQSVSAGPPTHPVIFAIDAGPLGQSLTAFATTADIQLLYPYELVTGRRATRLAGGYTPEAALARLLAGSGLAARRVGERVFVLEAVAPAPTGSVRPAAERLGFTSDTNRSTVDNGALAPAFTDSRPAPAEVPADIVVTGTHIRGTNPGTPPVIAIDRDSLTRNGYGTVAQALQALTGNFAGTANEQSSLSFTDTTGTNASLATGVNLRGLGAGATLVLVNGQRVGGSGSEGAFSDVSLIPTGAFERAEVLLDGASAVYGSDAVGGVINILLRRKFVGAETRVRFGTVTQGGKRDVQAAQTVGRRWDTGGAMLTYEYDRSGRLTSADRRFARSSDLRSFGGTNHDLFYSLPGNILAVDPATGQIGPIYAIPTGQDGTRLTPADFQRGVVNFQNRRLGSNLIPRQIRHGAYGSVDQELGDHLTVSADMRYARRAFDARLPGAVAVIQLTRANPYYVSPTGAASQIIGYSLTSELGPIRSYGFAEALAGSVSAELDLGGGWKARSYGALAQERDRNTTDHTLNTTALNEALGSVPDIATTPFSTATDGFFNPYGNGASNSASMIAYVGNGLNNARLRSRVWTGHADADGSLFTGPSGPIKLALGGDLRRENFSAYGIGRTGGVGVRTLYDVGGARTVMAGFAELRAPIVGPDNGVAGVRRLDVSAAVRVEHYPRFGTTTNPKFGLTWEPVPGASLRASYGTSFRAPNLRQLGDAQRYSVTALTGANGATIPIIQLAGGNPDLGPERARSWTAGADLAPRFLPGFAIHATWFHTDFRQRIATPVNDNFARALVDPALVPFVQRLTPSNNAVDLARVQALLSDPAFVGSNPFPATSIGALVDTRYVNTGRVIVSGVDLQASYTLMRGSDRFDLSVSGSYLARYRERITPTSSPVDRLNLVGRPVDLRGRTTVGWRHGALDAQIGVNHVTGYRDLNGRPIHAWTTSDLQLGLIAPASMRWLAGTTVSIAVTNAFNTAPPFYDSPQGLGYDAANADALGRYVAIQLTRRW